MRQTWTRFPLFPPMLLLSVAAAGGCGVSDATKGLFVTEREAGAEGGGTSTSTGESGLGGAGGTPASTSSGSGGGGGDLQTTTTTVATTTTTTTSTGGPPPTLDCDSDTCPQGGESACCWSELSMGGTGECIDGPPSDATCNTQPTPGGLSTRIECQLPSHCDAGETCCAIRLAEGVNFYTTARCDTQCEYPNVTLCNPSNPVCPAVNGMATTCNRSQLLPDNYFVCSVR
jgi:hypothetical protein